MPSKAARRETKAQQAARRAEQISKSLDDAEDDLRGLLDAQAVLNKRVSDATAILQEHEASQELINKKIEVETTIKALNAEQTSTRDLRAESLSYVWKDVLAVAVEPQKATLDTAIADEQQRVQWQQEAQEIDQALHDGSCDRCGQPVHGEAKAMLEKRLTDLRAKPQPSGDLSDVMQSFTRIAGISPSGQVNQAINLDRQIGTNIAKLVCDSNSN